ncbi:FAD-binding oxidoreductase [Streptomyces boncukensis]|uniref:FAD-binding oxidoreductase n=1 Tax=Streptomyces boncukensis TaxID=2711219 RepID=A0A6G4WXB2_9ACTN|nr:FAD-binding protein [Streptomyces boncukensis]NGO69929.1 FAD-binding oxidoreductase [Streptomyces boncukensis]
MTEFEREQGRRGVLRAAALVGAGVAGVAGAGSLPAAASAAGRGSGATGDGTWPPPLGPVRVGPGDDRYDYLVSRGAANRFRGAPERVYVVGSTAQTVRAVQETLDDGKRIAVRSGGHCFEDFVDNPDVQSVIDMSGMTGVYYDPRRRAFAVEAGATLGEAYRRLYLGWGVTIPGGYCPDVGAGGHVLGGGYGPLCRMFGLVADYLYAVEVVVVDRGRKARSVVATREKSDPNRELWWAHTGGGGGNFGVVTRYWFRTPGVRATADTDPARLLPAPPATALTFSAEWSWKGMDEPAFTRMVTNHGRWHERTSGADSPSAAVYSEFVLLRRLAGAHSVFGQVAAAPGTDERLLKDHLGAIGEGVARPAELTTERVPWLTSALRGPGEEIGEWKLKIKSAYLRRRFTKRQIAALYRHFTRTDTDVVGGSVSLNSFGGKVNDVRPGDTAVAQRDSVLKLSYLASWKDDKEEAAHLAWIRECYRDVYGDTGGVPVPGEVNDGAFVNYPDIDLADPGWNRSDTSWQTLLYKDNHRRLLRVKRRWDPGNVFHHALSIGS